jgi:hypothetical protein
MSRLRLANRELDGAARHYDGPYRPYDLLKEVCVATGIVIALAVALTVVFSSPDDPPSTVATWSRQMPVDFVTTAVSELDGTSDTATYGPPYNHASDGQHIAFVYLAKWLGVSHPINTAQEFVIAPLRSIPGDPPLRHALAAYNAAPTSTQAAWTSAYTTALAKATSHPGGAVSLPAGKYGPLTTMMSSLLALAQSGGLDGDLLTSKQFYQTDYTKPLLLMEDGSALTDRAQAQHLLGEQWGMMNETGSYPGQVWLWLYTFWYQIKPFSTSDNADALVMAIMGVLSLGLILIPFLPGIRRIPLWVPIYKVIWRDHYREQAAAAVKKAPTKKRAHTP